ncbi:MAG: diacylglycerol kinase family lipid kinase [Planctomycetia bacterium]|nr:diacylglycerol kinase family lipid kinase [Planctomycetia bacterium]
MTRLPITVISNASSGTSKRVELEMTLQAHFAKYGAQAKIILVENGASLITRAREAVAEGCRTLVAAGGDGTINAIASVVVDTEVALGVLPLGTLNHFAKDLGIPLDIERAVKTIVDGDVRSVDVGEVNGRVFVNNSSLGLYPTLVREREQRQSLGRSKWSAFALASLTVLGRYPFVKVAITIDGKQISRKTPLVFIGNNRYLIEGLRVGQRDRLDAGVLSVYLTRDIGRVKLIWFALRALFGKLRDEKDFDALETTALRIITSGRRVRVSADGEIEKLDIPLEYRIRPGALQVVVPRAAEKQKLEK